MIKSIQFLDWQQIEVGKEEIASIGNDIILLEKPIIKSFFDYPFKVDMTVGLICLSGKADGYINLKPYSGIAPSMTIILPDQILQHKYISEDFAGLFIIMSKRFIDNLGMRLDTSLFMSINNNPVVPLSDANLQSTVTYYTLLKDAIKNTENPYRMETVKHLTKAFFYGTMYQFHRVLEEKNRTKHEILMDKFLTLAKKYYKQERNAAFYADKLCLTPKYMSTLIKANTGLSVNNWIDRYVILEAKALLKSTNMTIQQISDELNFPSQSFFGKYFKRIEGISPREYRNKK